MHREVTVAPHTPILQGYAFLSKGIAYKTLHCRKLTHEAGKVLYVVVDDKKTLGLRAPKNIVSQVHAQAKETLSTRRATVEKRDASEIAKADKELQSLFPKIPAAEKDSVLQHGFKKHSRRVGRTASLPLQKKLMLAVIAHIRHKHTEYDALLRAGDAKDVARKATWKKIEGIMCEWGCTQGLAPFSEGRSRKRKPKKQLRSKASSRTTRIQSDEDDSDADYV
ncbi:hypothetical protein DE146DRAFT_638148 [Phaeosphaeria sp. MPI-PUGE-AT-0046c]|nr:hypothetical protein DE146DRAFT_638148 [Phaeosphaeria sp. MPI-PUGE-AT-0046c]